MNIKIQKYHQKNLDKILRNAINIPKNGSGTLLLRNKKNKKEVSTSIIDCLLFIERTSKVFYDKFWMKDFCESYNISQLEFEGLLIEWTKNTKKKIITSKVRIESKDLTGDEPID